MEPLERPPHDPRTTLAGRRIPANEAVRACKNAGWTNVDKLVDAVATMYAESAGYTRATNENANGTIDRGPWQINSIHVDAGEITEDECFQLGPSTAFAYRLYQRRSYSMGAWVAYTSGAYQEWRLVATRGLGNAYRYWYHLPFLVEQT